MRKGSRTILHSLRVLAVFLAFLFGACGTTEELLVAPMPGAAVYSRLYDFSRACEALDVDRIVSFYAPEARSTTPGELARDCQGREAIRACLVREVAKIRSLKIVLTDDVQVTPSTRRTLTTQGFRAVWTTKDGAERNLEGRQVATWEERNGEVVIIHEQLFGTMTRRGEEVLSIPFASPVERPEPTIVVAVPQLPDPSPPNPVRPSRSTPSERVATFSSPDWKGEPVYVIHFGSFKDRKRAEQHAALLSKETGMPALAAGVDLGAKGIWYRSLVGKFRAMSEATHARERLLTERREGIGQVFRMTGVR